VHIAEIECILEAKGEGGRERGRYHRKEGEIFFFYIGTTSTIFLQSKHRVFFRKVN